MTLITSFMSSTRQEWFMRVHLHIRHRDFVSRTAIGVVCMLITSLNSLRFRHIHTHIPRKDDLQNNMVGFTMTKLTRLSRWIMPMAHSSEWYFAYSGEHSEWYVWECLVMPHELSNALAMFNRLVTQLIRPYWDYAQTYFDNICVHSRVEEGQSDVDSYIGHLRAVLE